jgi:hypothetical protein
MRHQPLLTLILGKLDSLVFSTIIYCVAYILLDRDEHNVCVARHSWLEHLERKENFLIPRILYEC